MNVTKTLKISKGDLIIKSISHIESESKKNNKNVIHLTIHPKESLQPNQLAHMIRTKVISNLNEQCKIRNEHLTSMFVIEFGKDITDIDNVDINRLGTHAHIILSTNLSTRFVEEKAKQFFPYEASVHANEIHKFYDKKYWVKDYYKFSDITFWSNNKSIQVS